ncbi:MAG: TetM/TetW/TetO/TetS family tetracycline resistance ribosomal protection protein [Eubacteriales bacterium]|nr:TetM/TetW/TetO/TetS family tetracycline resistance ribosomal protection protein [Eubacteriales bacterium]
MKRLTMGILAHVDAGKTTLSEGMLFLGGMIRKAGRVDHKDAFLDTYELEKERGITIFSKQAVLNLKETAITLLDTPGHVDFSAEMERTLQVLDYAILVVSGADGVQGHTMTLWKLLDHYQIPTFLFVNKMDQEGTDREKLLQELKSRLSENCIDFDPTQNSEEFFENIAVTGEKLLEQFLEEGEISEKQIADGIRKRTIYPCYFGSALRMEGVMELLQGIDRYTRMKKYPEAFGGRVFKIARDEKGNRLSYVKVTGGSLKVKMPLTYEIMNAEKEQEVLEEKADQLRIYSGARFEPAQEVFPGQVCAVTGLTGTYPGQGLGWEKDSMLPVLEPVLNYRIILPTDVDVHQMLRKLKELEEEDPQLHIIWDEQVQEIHAMLMGEVQIEILKKLIWDRFHVAVDFGEGSVVYRETIENSVEGVGHFEPLRHYAEVHLLLEPGERGSGLQFFTACSEDILDRNWQRLILTHLEEKEHLGVLTGSPVTDLQITLVNGRAHLKHTEGGDFRQATYRAVRNGLKKARSILLEPYYHFSLEIPADTLGRAMNDIQRMGGSLESPELEGDTAILKGRAPVSKMRSYQAQVTAYTRGEGRLFCSLGGYEPCAEQEEVVAGCGYDSERDLENPTGSVFCAHGAGFVVPWYEVENYMHLDLQQDTPPEDIPLYPETTPRSRTTEQAYADEKELQEIFERTFGPVKRRLSSGVEPRRVSAGKEETYRAPKKRVRKEDYLLVDGYNIIFSWEELRELSKINLQAAQDRLKDILCNYQGIRKNTVILVFDAYKVEGHQEEVSEYHNIHVVFTKEAETADQYIEKTVHKIGKEHQVTVATSDGLEQIIIMGQGAARLSAKGLQKEIETAENELRQTIHASRQSSKSYLLDGVSEEVAEYLEKIRLED